MAAFTPKQQSGWSIATETVMPNALDYLALHRKHLLTLGLGLPNINIWHFAIFVFISLPPHPLFLFIYEFFSKPFKRKCRSHDTWSLNISACVLRTSLLFSINHIIMITPRVFNINTILLTNIQISPKLAWQCPSEPFHPPFSV